MTDQRHDPARPSARRFQVVVDARPRGGIIIPVPFDPAEAWGEREAYHVHGLAHGNPYRGEVTVDAHAWRLELGPSWCRQPGFSPGDAIDVEMALEGPQSGSMGHDVTAAFRAEPEAARFFDSMPIFYRNNAARALESAKRPETRAHRLAEIIDLAKQRQRER